MDVFGSTVIAGAVIRSRTSMANRRLAQPWSYDSPGVLAGASGRGRICLSDGTELHRNCRAISVEGPIEALRRGLDTLCGGLGQPARATRTVSIGVGPEPAHDPGRRASGAKCRWTSGG